MQRFLSFFILVVFLASCRPESFSPKPRGYAHVDFPKRAYQQFNETGFPYSFEIPIYIRVEKDTVFLGKKPENPYWINIIFPSLGGQIYVSYKEITNQQPLSKLLQESHEMSFTVHSKRADYIDENAFQMGRKVYGIIYDVGGNAASSYQFIATDSVKHFLRGALYFDVTPNADSLKPISDFLKKDLEHLLQTLTWRN
jgi:gliding motility-associated lipoprotein GldD